MKKIHKNNENIFVFSIIASLIFLNLISLSGFFRIDLTRDKKFTLGRASIETLARLEDTLTVNAYFTENLPPPYAQNARYVQDLLQEYSAKSNGKFAYQFLDPQTSETEEDREKRKNLRKDIFGRVIRESTSVEKELSSLGIEPVEIRVIEGDQQQTKRAYMGLVIRYQDKHEVIPLVQNLSELEKDLTALMRKLIRIRTPILGLVMDVSGPNLSKLKNALAKNVEVKEVNLKAESISDDVDALLIIGMQDPLGEDGQKKVSDFLKKGKNATILVDRYQVDPRTFEEIPKITKVGANRVLDLLNDFGISIGEGLIADANCASLNIQEQRGAFSFAMPIKYPFVPELLNLSYESPVSKGLSGVVLPFVSEVIISEKENVKSIIIAQSSKISWQEKEPLNLNPRRDWAEDKITPDGPHPLIAELRGHFFEGNDIESRLIVAGTSAFMWDEFLSEGNLILALNMIDFMIADTAILEMRSRNFQEAPIKVDLNDNVKFLLKLFNIFGVPLLLILYGLWRWRRREKRRHEIKFA